MECARRVFPVKDLPFSYSSGLTQTRFGKKADALDAASATGGREVADARGPRRTDSLLRLRAQPWEER